MQIVETLKEHQKQQLPEPQPNNPPPNDSQIVGTKYLYLAEELYAQTWVEGGGPIPIKRASTYISDHREGTSTPDENLIYKSPVDLSTLGPGIMIPKNVNVKSLTIVGNTFNGKAMPDIRNADHYREDGLVLCFSNTQSDEICKRLSKKVCVAIDDVARLKEVLDSQIGVKSRAGTCTYTSNHERNHFLKHAADKWMDEFRLFWPTLNEASVYLPAGLVRHCALVGTSMASEKFSK